MKYRTKKDCCFRFHLHFPPQPLTPSSPHTLRTRVRHLAATPVAPRWNGAGSSTLQLAGPFLLRLLQTPTPKIKREGGWWWANGIIIIIFIMFEVDPISCFVAMLPNYKTSFDRKTRDHLVRTAENGDPMHEVCIPHMIPRAWEQRGWSKRKKQTQE